jgi:MFS family permease
MSSTARSSRSSSPASRLHFLAVLPVAWLADRTARRSVIAVGLFVWSTMTALGGLAQSFVQLFAARMGVGIGEAAGSPPAVSLLSDTAPLEWRARALASISVGSLLGIAFGMIVGGWISEQYGWRAALITVGLPGLLVAILVRFSLREPPRAGASAASPLAAARHLFGLRSFSWMVAAACLAGIGVNGRILWEPAFLHRIYGLSYAEVGLVYVLIGALPAALGALLGGTLSDRLGTRDARWSLWICGLGNLLATPFVVAFLLWPADDLIALGTRGIPAGYAFAVLGSLFAGFFSPPTAAVAQSLATPRMRALAHAIWTMLFNLIGMGVGPLVVGALSEGLQPSLGQDSLRYAMVAISVTLPLSALVFGIAARFFPADLERVREGRSPD